MVMTKYQKGRQEESGNQLEKKGRKKKRNKKKEKKTIKRVCVHIITNLVSWGFHCTNNFITGLHLLSNVFFCNLRREVICSISWISLILRIHRL